MFLVYLTAWYSFFFLSQLFACDWCCFCILNTMFFLAVRKPSSIPFQIYKPWLTLNSTICHPSVDFSWENISFWFLRTLIYFYSFLMQSYPLACSEQTRTLYEPIIKWGETKIYRNKNVAFIVYAVSLIYSIAVHQRYFRNEKHYYYSMFFENTFITCFESHLLG